MKAGRESAVLVQLIVLYMPSRILFFSHKRGGGGGGALFFRVMEKQGHKISFLKILNYTSPPPLINYDQSLTNGQFVYLACLGHVLLIKPGFHMVITVVKIESRSFSSAEYNILELKIHEVIITREYL